MFLLFGWVASGLNLVLWFFCCLVGLLFGSLISFCPPLVRALRHWGFPFFFSCFALFCYGSVNFCRTVSLDVSRLAGSNDRKSVSSFIVEHFARRKIHAAQFIGTTAEVTVAVEASKQVISHQAININGVQCAVWGGGPRVQNVLV